MFSKVPSCAFSGFWTLTLKLTQHFDLIYNIGKLITNELEGFRRGCILKNLKLIKFNMSAYQPLFTSTGLILWNIMKTAQDIYTITIKQAVRLQERMHFEKIQLVQVQNGRQSAIIHFHMAVIW